MAGEGEGGGEPPAAGAEPPAREEQIRNALAFLTHPKVCSPAPLSHTPPGFLGGTRTLVLRVSWSRVQRDGH